jgi:hypothetical protein
LTAEAGKNGRKPEVGEAEAGKGHPEVGSSEGANFCFETIFGVSWKTIIARGTRWKASSPFAIAASPHVDVIKSGVLVFHYEFELLSTSISALSRIHVFEICDVCSK